MKIIIEIDDDKGHGIKLFKALLVWKKRANAGGDAALAFHQYDSSEKKIDMDERGRMINCGFVGHDIIIRKIDIEK